ncbi:MAG: zinc ribbon domain-containing protein [Thermoplasmata archaeon]|nr:zinc ribbon domain-containing protein [Thermoplasmata archaeon]
MSAPAARAVSGSSKEDGPPPPDRPPFLLDFYPLEEANQTGLSMFYDALRQGRLTTTRCPNDATITWPPRTVCPKCHRAALEWIELPRSGTLYAFSAVLVGAPLGMESDVPFAVGLVDLDGVPLRLFGRIAGRPWTELTVGGKVVFEPFDLPDGRVFYRFRATS